MASWAWRQFDTWARARQATLKDPAADLTALLGPCTCPRDTDAAGTALAGSVGTLAALRRHHHADGSGIGAVTDPDVDRVHQLGCPHHPDTTLEALRADAVIEAARLLVRHLGLNTDDAPTTTGTHDSSTATSTTGARGTGTVGADTGGGAVANGGTGAGVDVSSGANAGAGRGRSWSSAVVIVDAPTLLGLADNPGWVPGHGWVPAPLARELSAGADTWRAFLTDHGRLVATGSTRYRPSNRLRELITARDTTCTFPGCTIPSVHTDLDHAATYDGANTTAGNLHPACRRHHRIKTHSDWSAAPDPGSGRIHWTSPTGHTYPTPPDPIWDTGPPPPEQVEPDGDIDVDRAIPAPGDSSLERWTAAVLAA